MQKNLFYSDIYNILKLFILLFKIRNPVIIFAFVFSFIYFFKENSFVIKRVEWVEWWKNDTEICSCSN